MWGVFSQLRAEVRAVRPEALPDDVQVLSRNVVDSALRVHRSLGPGLLESVYETCLQHELSRRGVQTARQGSLPITYDGLTLDGGLRLEQDAER